MEINGQVMDNWATVHGEQ